MYAIAVIRYRRALDEVLAQLDEHRAYLGDLHARGIVLASGPFDPRSGGALLLRVSDTASREELDAVRDGDPFVRKGIAQYEVQLWMPTFGKDLLDALAPAPRR